MNEYKRLTQKDDKGRWAAEAGHFCVYHDDKSPCAADMMHGDIVNRLAELENKIESGELVELPRKSKVYINDGDLKYRVVYLGIDKEIHSTFFEYERQADSFVEEEKARMRKGESR